MTTNKHPTLRRAQAIAEAMADLAAASEEFNRFDNALLDPNRALAGPAETLCNAFEHFVGLIRGELAHQNKLREGS